MRRISERLEKIAYYVKDSVNVADIGTDHAYLPIYLAEQGVVKKLVLTDINEGPLQKAKQNNEKYASHDCSCDVSFKIGDGLTPLEIGEVDTAVIAGMGGELIVKILSFDSQKTNSIETFILQPRTKCDNIRHWIYDNNYTVIAEDLALERDKICEIIVFSTKKSVNNFKDELFDVLKKQLDYLFANNNPLLLDYLKQKIQTESDINVGISMSRSEDEMLVANLSQQLQISKERVKIYNEYLHKLKQA